MSRLRLFVDAPLLPGALLPLPAEAARHVQVRRLQPGDELVLFDGRGGEWRAVVRSMGRREVSVEPLSHHTVDRELPLAVTLAVGMPANERMDWLVEKAVELGATALQPLQCERAVLRLDGERGDKRRAHWQAQALAATGQCGRTRVMTVHPVCTLADWLRESRALSTQRWLLDPLSTQPPSRPAAGSSVGLLSGPEGGFTEAESGQAIAAGFVPVSLGPRVLRADTAPLALLAWLGLGG